MVGFGESFPSIIDAGGDRASQVERLQILLSVSGIVGLLKYLEQIFEALEPNTRGYNPKTNTDEIFKAIRSIYDDETLSSSALEARTQDFPAQNPMQRFPSEMNSNLSDREIEVLQLMAQGAANKEIAATLSIGQSTVKTHIAHIFEKLQVNRRTEAVTEALRRRIIVLQPQAVLQR